MFCHCLSENGIIRLIIKPGIQERGTEWGKCRERQECSQGFRGISWRIPGNVIFLTLRGMSQKISTCSKRFRGMFEKIPRYAQKDSGKCSRRFLGMFQKIPRNVVGGSENINLDLFCKI